MLLLPSLYYFQLACTMEWIFVSFLTPTIAKRGKKTVELAFPPTPLRHKFVRLPFPPIPPFNAAVNKWRVNRRNSKFNLCVCVCVFLLLICVIRRLPTDTFTLVLNLIVAS
ncbi:GPI-anchored surface protein, putative [Bodo saltans]|uniref:GPI-anchored surface protein, putative n=1 Tax=Bodo saltans TaxID=75058 RepID=A0A0S4IPZ5_BODSA|nr:GPI-anchored surface protein, putative [Bodo saltans]|eukprot:CUF90972.1 GPI-anchored surface protein, putative [Bodo saltans]